jgi:hypothetical protein
MNELTLSTGPRCPRCHCPALDRDVVVQPTADFPQGVAVCDNPRCGMRYTFTAPPEAAVSETASAPEPPAGKQRRAWWPWGRRVGT